MRLTERTDVAFRILMHLAHHPNQRSSIDDIVEWCNSHRSQVVSAIQLLRKAGYIGSSAGRIGGIWLERDAGDITLVEIVQLMENDFQIARCFGEDEDSECSLHKACKLKNRLERALSAFFNELSGTTLDDLLGETEAPECQKSK